MIILLCSHCIEIWAVASSTSLYKVYISGKDPRACAFLYKPNMCEPIKLIEYEVLCVGRGFFFLEHLFQLEDS